jgi:hypothetical protein
MRRVHSGPLLPAGAIPFPHVAQRSIRRCATTAAEEDDALATGIVGHRVHPSRGRARNGMPLPPSHDGPADPACARFAPSTRGRSTPRRLHTACRRRVRRRRTPPSRGVECRKPRRAWYGCAALRQTRCATRSPSTSRAYPSSVAYSRSRLRSSTRRQPVPPTPSRVRDVAPVSVRLTTSS